MGRCAGSPAGRVGGRSRDPRGRVEDRRRGVGTAEACRDRDGSPGGRHGPGLRRRGRGGGGRRGPGRPDGDARQAAEPAPDRSGAPRTTRVPASPTNPRRVEVVLCATILGTAEGERPRAARGATLAVVRARPSCAITPPSRHGRPAHRGRLARSVGRSNRVR